MRLKLKRLVARDWAQIEPAWLVYASRLPLPGTLPIEKLAELPDLDQALDRVPSTGDFDASVEGCRTSLLHQGIALAHKACYGLPAALDEIENGRPTWGMASAYQCARFASEAIVSLLGVAVVEKADISYFVDVWPEGFDVNVAPDEVKLIKVERHSFDHKQMWQVFQRLVRVTNCRVWDEDLATYLGNIEARNFTLQRNKIYYGDEGWVFGDLCSSFTDLESICNFSDIELGREARTSIRSPFTTAVAMLLVRNLWAMLNNLAIHSSQIALESELMSRNLIDRGNETLQRRGFI